MYLIKQEKRRGRGKLKKPFIPLWVKYCWEKYSQIQNSWAANKKWSQSGAAPKCEFNGLNKCEEVCCWESVFTQKTLPGWKTYTTINNLHKHFKGKKSWKNEVKERRTDRERQTICFQTFGGGKWDGGQGYTLLTAGECGGMKLVWTAAKHYTTIFTILRLFQRSAIQRFRWWVYCLLKM